MNTLTSIQVNGLRSIFDSKDVPIKPLNTLVGSNSSGKSTFLIVFLLLRQSIDEITRGFILCYGKLADFEFIEKFSVTRVEPVACM